MTKFTYASLFSGIGGFEQALNKLGGSCVFASEIDKFAAQAYEVLYGEVPAGDITKIEAKDIPDHDLLVGGFPCQAFSVAGKRQGFEDTRGTLFFEIARIAKEKQPKALLLENVKGLVNHDKGRTLDVMIETLNEIGYTVDFDVLNSKYFGVPQNRERIFIVAIRGDLIGQSEWSEETTKGQSVVPKGKRRLMTYDWLKSFNFGFPEQVEVTTRLRDILETDVNERYYLDEEKTKRLVEQLYEGAGLGKDGELGTLVNGVNISPCIDVNYAKGIGPADIAKNRNRRPMYTEPQMVGHVDIKGNDTIKRTYSTEGISPTLTTMGGGHREPKIAEEVLPVLTPDRMEKRQNGRRFKEDGEEMFTLTSQDRHGVALREIIESNVREIASKSRPNEEIEINFKENGDIRPHRTDARKSGLSELNINHEDNPSFTVSAAHSPKVYGNTTRYRIRKLTPRECWRLQGFPDEAHDAVESAGISDSQRYKQAGNAVTVNVIEAIAERLIPLIS